MKYKIKYKLKSRNYEERDISKSIGTQSYLEDIVRK